MADTPAQEIPNGTVVQGASAGTKVFNPQQTHIQAQLVELDAQRQMAMQRAMGLAGDCAVFHGQVEMLTQQLEANKKELEAAKEEADELRAEVERLKGELHLERTGEALPELEVPEAEVPVEIQDALMPELVAPRPPSKR